ncbi:MAG: efflux RND transporter periplasmic adaptor subunit [Sphingobacteriales bacterium]|nr:MAG: efflux RND transporter periplasmic adaptor subunit [Sphingobacteriales bacterium]
MTDPVPSLSLFLFSTVFPVRIVRTLLLILSAGALLVQTSCKSVPKNEDEQTKFVVTSVLKADTSLTKQYVCQVRAISHIELRAQEQGYLQKIFVDEGQFVRQGQPLFQVMPNLYQAEKQRAEAEASYAGIEYQNTKRLADSNVVSPTEAKLARAKLAQAQAAVNLAKVHLQFTDIRAPFSGIIDRFQVRLGSLVEDGQLLTTLSDNSQMWIYFNVPEAEYLDFKSNPQNDTAIPVQLLMANGQIFDQKGYVKTIEADFDNETGNIAFRATFPNPKGLLRHGETGNILVHKPVPNALIIPQKATMEIMDKKYVYALDRNSKVQLRPITIAAELPDLYIVGSGLAEGDRILLEGIRKVQNGQKITYDYQEPRKVMDGLSLHAE